MIFPPRSIKKALLDYYASYLGRFQENLLIARLNQDEEAIHDYRVSVKRIRAVTRALNEVMPKKVISGELVRPFREMFKAGGSIRDDQVQVGIIGKIERKEKLSFTLVKDEFTKMNHDQLEYFMERSKNFDVNAVNRFISYMEAILQYLDELELKKGIYVWINHEMDRLKQDSQEVKEPKALHSFRTNYKIVTYLVEMLIAGDVEPKAEPVAYARLKDFGQELGNWHDHYALLERLNGISLGSHEFELLKESFTLHRIVHPMHEVLFDAMLAKLSDENLFRYQ
jgi:CHAD domain-containing protein